MIIAIAAAAAALCAGFALVGTALASRLCASIVPFEDGPPPGKPSVPLLIAGAAIFGAVLAFHGESLEALGVAAVLCFSLCAVWYSDVRCGIIPDVFTLAPLTVVLAAAAFFHNWPMLASSAIVFLPFAGAALISKGRGMGWGDAKLVALGGAVLGAQSAILSFGVACTVAVVVALVRNRRHEPIAFGPYLIAAMSLSVVVVGLPL